MEENLSVTFVVGRAFAFVLFVILLLLWLSCCWCFLIPCCMRCCCRCCEVHHQLGKRASFHVFLWLFFLLLAATCVISQAFSFPAYHGIDQGLRGTACYSAHLVQDVVSGNNVTWPGDLNTHTYIYNIRYFNACCAFGRAWRMRLIYNAASCYV